MAELTPAQRHYLDAFDRFLRAPTAVERHLARADMRECLGPVCAAAGIDVPSRRRITESHLGDEAEPFIAMLGPG